MVTPISIQNFQFDFTTHDPGIDVVVSKYIHQNKIWEEFLSNIWLDNINEGDLVIDIGSNIGWYSKLASLKGAEVISIEPDTRNFEILSKNCSECHLYNVAVGAENTDIFIDYSSDGNYGDSRISSTRGQKISQIRLDDIVSKYNRPIKAIKIDVQGWEPYVIQGGKNTFLNLEKNSLVLLEFCPSLLKTNNFDLYCFEDFFKLFSETYAIRKNKKMNKIEMYDFLNSIKNDTRTFYVDTINIK